MIPATPIPMDKTSMAAITALNSFLVPVDISADPSDGM